VREVRTPAQNLFLALPGARVEVMGVIRIELPDGSARLVQGDLDDPLVEMLGGKAEPAALSGVPKAAEIVAAIRSGVRFPQL
jgi:hypothetical protein